MEGNRSGSEMALSLGNLRQNATLTLENTAFANQSETLAVRRLPLLLRIRQIPGEKQPGQIFFWIYNHET